jgi:RNA polymerase sigma-70 factor, ECF subfamily
MRGYALPAEADERRITAATDPDDAFDALYRGYAPALRAYCQARLGNLADAEDACHEAIIRAHSALPRFERGHRLWPWLATIAANVCRDMQRRQATVAANTTRVEAVVDDIDELAAARMRRSILVDALAGMPERYRAHVRMCDLEGWTYQELAALDGTTVASVRSTLHRARSVLRERVRDTADRRHQWPLPAFVPLAFSRMRARLARARDVAAPVAEPLGRFDTFLGLVTHPALAQGVFSLAAVIGVGIGVVADAYAAEGTGGVTTVAMQNTGLSFQAVSSWGASWSADRPWSAADTHAPDDVAAPSSSLPDVAAPTEPTATFSAPAPGIGATTPDAPSMPSFDAQAPSAPPPPVHMTSSPQVSTPIDGSGSSYYADLPSGTVDSPTVPPLSVDPLTVNIEQPTCTGSEAGPVGGAVCSGQTPQAPSDEPEPELDQPTVEVPLTA